MRCGDGILDIRHRHPIRIRKSREYCICGVLMGAAALVFLGLEQELGPACGCEALVLCGKGELLAGVDGLVLVVCVPEWQACELVLVVCVLEWQACELVQKVYVLELPVYVLVLKVCVQNLQAYVLVFLSDHNDFRYRDHSFCGSFSIHLRHHHDLFL